MKNLIAIVLVLAACGKSDDKKADKAEAAKPVAAEPAKPAAPPKPTPLPVQAFVELDPGKLAFKPAAVLGKTPEDIAKALPQFLRKDKTSAAVSAKTDELMAGMEADLKAKGIDVKKNSGKPEFRLPPTPGGTRPETHVILHTDDDGTVRQYGVWFETTAAEKQEIIDTFDKLWGKHKIIDETLGPQMTWFDAASGFRASTRVKADNPDRIDIDYVRYLPLAKFFGEPGPLWGFEKAERPFLGATTAEIEATYGKVAVSKESETITLELPPTDYDGNSSHTRILMFTTKGKVRQWNTHIPFEDYEPARAEYGAALDAKFGKPKPARREHLVYGKKPKVDVNYSKFTDELDIEVTP
jgi:hypothetical protein